MNKPAIDWQDEGTRNQLLGELVHDARLLLRLTAGPELSEAETEARGLLVAVTEQDSEAPGARQKTSEFRGTYRIPKAPMRDIDEPHA